MLLSAVSVLVVAQSSSEIPEGLMNNPVISRPFSSAFSPLLDGHISGRLLSEQHIYVVTKRRFH